MSFVRSSDYEPTIFSSTVLPSSKEMLNGTEKYQLNLDAHTHGTIAWEVYLACTPGGTWSVSKFLGADVDFDKNRFIPVL